MEISGYDIIGINIGKYSRNNNTAISLDCNEGKFATITVNFNENLDEGMAYLDTNNCSWVEDIMKKYCLGEPTGEYKQSGFCIYPLYKLDLQAIKEFDNKIRK